MTTPIPVRHNIPAHVPPELVLPIGLVEGPEFLKAPHAFMASLHQTHPPVFFSPSEYGPDVWTLIKHEDCFHVLRHPEIFTSKTSTPFPRDPDNYFPMVPVEIDPPDHRKYRAILEPMLTPAAIGKLEVKIRKLANDLIDEFIGDGMCEFTTAFGRPLPVSVFLDLMGLPQDMRDTFVSWAMGLLHSQNQAEMQRAMDDTCAYLQKVIEEKTRNPDDKAVSAIVHGRAAGNPLTAPEIFGFVFFLFIAGLDTVFATLNNIFAWFADNPERRHEIISNPQNINNATEELLRVFSVTFSGRSLTRDYELRGVKMKMGDRVTTVLPAANYDPDVFENPSEVDFNRVRKPNLAFAGGVHSCMGAHLARMETKICIEEFLRRIPDFRLKAGTKLEYLPGGVVGPKVVPLQW